MTSTHPLVRAENVQKSFGDNKVLDGMDFSLEAGKVACLLGPSGSGKTTFLRCLNQLETISGGAIWIDDELIGFRPEKGVLIPLPERAVVRQRSKIGMVFQQFNLFSHMTVLENVIEAPVHVLKMSRSHASKLALEMLDRVGLADKQDHYPRQLSGGQQQRVAVARAVVNNPKLILADEPTGNLDSSNGNEVMTLLTDLNEQGTTIIMVTHSEHDSRFSHRIIRMLDGQTVTENILV